MSRFFSSRLNRLSPYVPGEQAQRSDVIKLNTNEHAMLPSLAALEAGRTIDPEQLRKYPDPHSRFLTKAIADFCDLAEENVLVANGSDEILAFAWTAFLSDKELQPAIPAMTYTFYPVWAQLLGKGLYRVPMNEDLSIDLKAMASWSGPVVFPNPNAPTAMAVSVSDIEALCASNPNRLVVIDEAYQGFGADTAVPLIGRFDNLLITRSFSKSHALAGLRVGYALGARELIEGLRRVKDSFNSYPVDAHAQAVAAAAISDTVWFQRASATIIENRKELEAGLEGLGFRVLTSHANFLLASHPQQSGVELTEKLRKKGVLVRSWSSEDLMPWVRITVGTRNQQQTLLAELQAILAEA